MDQLEDMSASLAATKGSVDELSMQMLPNEGVEPKLSDTQETLTAILKATKEQTASVDKYASSLQEEILKQNAELRQDVLKQNAELRAAMVKQHAELRQDVLKQNADSAVLMLKQTAALIAAVQEQTKAIEKLAAPARESGKRKRVEDTAADAGNQQETNATGSQTSAAEKLLRSSLKGRGPADAVGGTSTAGGRKKKMKAPAPAPAKEVLSVNATEGTCTWTISNFSKLKVSELGWKISDTFSIGGHKWKLWVYPRGYLFWKDKSVSLFLYLADNIDKLAKDGKVPVDFSLSVICQHDPEKSHKGEDSKNKEFHAKAKNLGFRNLIPLTDFHDVANGFLVNDTVTFKAKIEVKKKAPAPPKEVVSVNAASPLGGTYTWTIPNFSKLKVNEWGSKYSDVFSIGGHKWKLWVYPKGRDSGKEKFVSLYLYLVDDTDKLPKDGKVTASFSMSVISQHDPEKSRKNYMTWDFEAFKGAGFSNFMPLTDLNDAANGFLVNDIVIFEAKIEVKKPAKTS